MGLMLLAGLFPAGAVTYVVRLDEYPLLSDETVVEEPLLQMLEKGASRNEVEPFLSSEASIDEPFANGMRPVMAACYYPVKSDVVSLFLERGADPKADDGTGLDALSFAALSDVDPIEKIKVLRTKGLSLRTKDQWGRTLLHRASFWGKPETLGYLLDEGLRINQRDEDGYTPLVFAASSNPDTKAIQMLVDRGADVRATTNEGMNAFLCAALDNDNPAVLDVLARNGCRSDQVDRQGNDALMLSTMNPNYEVMLKLLFSYPVDVKRVNKQGQSALLVAATSDWSGDVLRTLLDFGSDIRLRDMDGMSVLRTAIDSALPAPSIGTLIEAGCDVNESDKESRTILMDALLFESSDVLSMLVQSGADL